MPLNKLTISGIAVIFHFPGSQGPNDATDQQSTENPPVIVQAFPLELSLYRKIVPMMAIDIPAPLAGSPCGQWRG